MITSNIASSYKLRSLINFATYFNDNNDETIDPMLAKTLLILGNAIFYYIYNGSIVMYRLQYAGNLNNFLPALKLML